MNERGPSDSQVYETQEYAPVEEPITIRAYLTCVFSAFGGILFGYDSGYINGVLGMDFFKCRFSNHTVDFCSVTTEVQNIEIWQKSLITSILSAGTFLGALAAGSLADTIGRRPSIILACFVFILGVIIQTASASVGVLVAGRIIAGLGVGVISATVILYMSEIAPRRIRGALVATYQFAITVGILLAACVAQGTKDRKDAGSYRIPIALQMLWAIILAGGLFLLPESPRYWVKKGHTDRATASLVRIRGEPADSDIVQIELADILANYEYEMSISSSNWSDCLRGGRKPSGNLYRVFVGVALQMFQQLTGVNFIFYYGTTFFQSAHISDPFLISIATNVVNVGSTPLSWWAIERFGRRKLLISGAILMLVCEFIIGAVGVAYKGQAVASTVLIVFVCIYIFGFATTWGPCAWVVIGEIFPLPIRAKGVSLSTASNWLWNFILAYITPYIVDQGEGDLQAKVFFIWGTCCSFCLCFAYFMVPETKGLSLEQIDRMLEECSPRESANWEPRNPWAHGQGRYNEKADVERI